jgi:hypothetical protein
MSDAKMLERVGKLIALAGSTNEHEARNAAYLACKLIREHKLIVSLEKSVSDTSRYDPNVAHAVHFAQASSLEDIFETLFGEEHVARARARSAERTTPPPPKPRPKKPEKKTTNYRAKNGAILIDAKYGGYCRDCGVMFREGERVWWKHTGAGCVHEACDPNELQP